ncbi:phosphinothricin acetyltransferase [Hylemonella gracilis ATCC 19624]|uniref:Phosphinothricin acetyltransferase n=2 Tax=Hylemonella gracilis TaxID=80880 RepID=F3KP42_9BURK|nr:phosphinothricin acetyltransferase [Hylemonella gracilis ATCC 19624]
MRASTHHTMQLIDCTLEAHGEAILAILNDAIVRTTALYDYKPRSMDSMSTWFQAKRAGGFPVIGFVDDDDGQGELLGFASYGTFRNFPAFKYTVEHSVYVHHAHRGKGLGRKLLQAIIERARAQQVHVMVGAIDATNSGSIALHEQLGFKPCGVVQQAGFKFRRWLDLALYQLILETPEQPVDG